MLAAMVSTGEPWHCQAGSNKGLSSTAPTIDQARPVLLTTSRVPLAYHSSLAETSIALFVDWPMWRPCLSCGGNGGRVAVGPTRVQAFDHALHILQFLDRLLGDTFPFRLVAFLFKIGRRGWL